jgi:hypothetical protein
MSTANSLSFTSIEDGSFTIRPVGDRHLAIVSTMGEQMATTNLNVMAVKLVHSFIGEWLEQQEHKVDTHFPKPKQNPNGPPCGECHLKQGETCDICGARRPSAS